MADDMSRRGSDIPRDGTDADEIEITEVQGLPADAPPPSGVGSGGAAGGEGDDASSSPEGGSWDREAGTGGLERDLQQAREDLLRVRADFENYRKRQVRERTEFARHAAAELVERILPVLDNFKRALAMEPSQEGGENYREGIRLIYRQLTETLAEAGLRPIETEGQPFDPNLHEAVAREETGAVAPNTITAELEPGYRFRDRLLKPARVRVAVPPPES